MSKKEKETEVVKHHLIQRRKPNRSVGGDIGVYIFLLLVGIAMVYPLVFAINMALKPMDELFMFPPKLFARNPTLDNFSDLFVNMSKSTVAFSRYVFNTVFITAAGTAGHLLIASMGAFVLAKYQFPGNQTFFKLVTTAMMFTGYVTQIPNYMNISVTQSGTLVAQTATFSPFFTPMAMRPFATRSTSCPHSFHERQRSLST